MHDGFLLDSDTAAGTNIETAEAIDDSLTKNESSINEFSKEIMSGLCVDTGGSGTRDGLSNETTKRGRAFSLDSFLTKGCARYGFNIMMASPYV